MKLRLLTCIVVAVAAGAALQWAPLGQLGSGDLIVAQEPKEDNAAETKGASGNVSDEDEDQEKDTSPLADRWPEMTDEQWQKLSPAEWRRRLSARQFEVTRKKGTDRPYTGKYWKTKAPGVYRCVCCGLPLFGSTAKFESGTGWPSYWQPVDPASVRNVKDRSFHMRRIEVICHRCGAHLGHVFNDAPQTPTGLRYCINSTALVLEHAPPEKEKDR